jgi:hypothetical protein
VLACDYASLMLGPIFFGACDFQPRLLGSLMERKRFRLICKKKGNRSVLTSIPAMIMVLDFLLDPEIGAFFSRNKPFFI